MTLVKRSFCYSLDMSRDWNQWHESYVTEPALAERLQIVQEQIRKCLPKDLSSPYEILDICAGDGRDLAGGLADYGYLDMVQGRLIEIDGTLAAKAKSALAGIGASNLEVVAADASNTASYRGAYPADLVLLCGIFGNISDEDIERTISVLPTLCKPDGKVIWTRNRREPDITPQIRNLFTQKGFVEIDFITPTDNTRKIAVGVNQFNGVTEALSEDKTLFTFLK
jgi:hypothetical protein